MKLYSSKQLKDLKPEITSIAWDGPELGDIMNQVIAFTEICEEVDVFQFMKWAEDLHPEIADMKSIPMGVVGKIALARMRSGNPKNGSKNKSKNRTENSK